MSPYPPGVNASTRTAPWNQPEAPECGCCRETIHTGDDHSENCENRGLNASELREQRARDAKHDRAEAKLEDRRFRPTTNELSRA